MHLLLLQSPSTRHMMMLLLVVMLVKTIAGAVSAGAIAAAAAVVLERVRRRELIHAPVVRACVVPPIPLSLCLRLRARVRECGWIGWIRPPLLCFPLFFWTADGWRLHSSKRTSHHLKIKTPHTVGKGGGGRQCGPFLTR